MEAQKINSDGFSVPLARLAARLSRNVPGALRAPGMASCPAAPGQRQKMDFEKMKLSKIIPLFLVACLIAAPIYATNVVWGIVIPEFHLSNAPLSEAVASLENISCKLDPKGRGIRIVYHKWPNRTGGEMTLNLTNIPLHEAVKFVGEMTGAPSGVYFVDDVAMFCDHQVSGPPVWHVAGISGRISDALTDAPITNAWLMTRDFNVSNEVSIANNGHFMATVQYIVLRPYLYRIRLYDKADDFARVTFGAPGYKNTETNLPLGDLMAYEKITQFEIRLERSK